MEPLIGKLLKQHFKLILPKKKQLETLLSIFREAVGVALRPSVLKKWLAAHF
jgi:hypothetical protein